MPPREDVSPPTGTEPPPAPEPPRRIVAKGDRLWDYALETYGDGNLYPLIVSANADKIRNANLIYPGQEFVLPFKTD